MAELPAAVETAPSSASQGEAATFQASASPTAPVVTVKDITINEGQPIRASTLIGSVVDPAGAKTTPAFLAKLADPGIKTEVAKLMVDGSLSYTAMLKILETAAVGGMTESKFRTLRTLASYLNASGGVTTSAYVEAIAKSVIDGDPANAAWTGGASSPIALGNLSATSTAAHLHELIGKWFFGTDLPSIDVASIGYTQIDATYEKTSNPLYGASGVPSYRDISQGNDGDCYLLALLGEVALRHPGSIESMIANNGNGSYGVRFFVDGKADYVTVNDELPTILSGPPHANDSHLEFANGDVAWPELIEKAYAELNAEPDAAHGSDLNEAANSYAGISGGTTPALSEITGQAGRYIGASTTLAQDAATLAAAWRSEEELLVSTPGAPGSVLSGNLISDHVYSVLGVNAATETLTLYNPYGSGYSGPLAMTFTETLSSLASEGCSVYYTTGKPLA